MTQPAPKLFKRQSGQMRAVKAEADEILEVTKAVVERVKSDPPPPLTRPKLPSDAGVYKVTTPRKDPRASDPGEP